MARVALDAMGGDHAPDEIIAGGVAAAEAGHDVILVGEPSVIAGRLDALGSDLPVVAAGQVIEMAENPARAIREKTDSSIAVAARLVKTGEADAMVSAGSTGATLAAATVILRRAPGVLRPVVASIFPTPGSHTVVLDSGANPDCKPEHLVQFGIMGALVADDIERSRLYALENSLERCGVESCAVYHSDVTELDFGEIRFNKILLDAPCSGNYVIDEEWFNKRTLDDVEWNAERQRGLLKTAVGLLKEGGVLSYTTCSLEPEENELNVQWLLDNFDVELREIRGPGSRGLTEVFGKKLDEDIGRSMRFWPEETGTQGFYVAEAVKK